MVGSPDGTKREIPDVENDSSYGTIISIVLPAFENSGSYMSLFLTLALAIAGPSVNMDSSRWRGREIIENNASLSLQSLLIVARKSFPLRLQYSTITGALRFIMLAYYDEPWARGASSYDRSWVPKLMGARMMEMRILLRKKIGHDTESRESQMTSCLLDQIRTIHTGEMAEIHGALLMKIGSTVSSIRATRSKYRGTLLISCPFKHKRLRFLKTIALPGETG